jgi:aspartate beta-hydroxylase
MIMMGGSRGVAGDASDERSRRERIATRTPVYERVGGVVRRIYDKRLAGPPILDQEVYFPNAARFVASWQSIRDEALTVARHLEAVPRFHDIMPEQAPLSAQDNRDWRLFVLKAYGIEVAPNMARCPTLSLLLQATPEVLSASLSCLAPRKHVPRHRGPFRGALRFHLGLSMPRGRDGRPAAVLTIGDREHRIADGECLLWDDTYPHEVVNESDEIRIALLLDVWRAGMPADMVLFSKLVVAVVQAIMRYRGVSYGG